MNNNDNKSRRVAVIGGTFDPIHYGHLAAAETVRDALQLDRVLFIPAGCPPHKDASAVTDAEHRYRMALLATADHPCFEVSRLELDRPAPSYTVDTVRTLIEMYKEIHFIAGADAIEQVPTWKDAETLLKLCPFVAVSRPGYAPDALRNAMAKLTQQYAARIELLETPGVAVSGTAIRERIAAGLPVRYLVPAIVEKYIRRNGLFIKTSQSIFNFDRIREQLSIQLSPARFRHTLGVVEASEQLAAHYGADTEKARIAALLHDCAKEYSQDKKRALCAVYDIKLDTVTDKQIDLAHSALSAEIARHEYRVEDEEILQAIRYHTTGHKNMTLMDKIIMLADFIEPCREEYPGLKKMRALSLTDIDGALRRGVKDVISNNLQRGRLIHPDSRDALLCLEKRRRRRRHK